MIIWKYLHNLDLIMTKQMCFLDTNLSEDPRVLKQCAIYIICSVIFHFFFKQLIRIITCISTVCWVLSLLHCLLFKRTELVNTWPRKLFESCCWKYQFFFFSPKPNVCFSSCSTAQNPAYLQSSCVWRWKDHPHMKQ